MLEVFTQLTSRVNNAVSRTQMSSILVQSISQFEDWAALPSSIAGPNNDPKMKTEFSTNRGLYLLMEDRCLSWKNMKLSLTEDKSILEES